MKKIITNSKMKEIVYSHKEWIIYFVIGCLLTCPFLIKVHFNGDAYALLSSSYEEYATVFMRSARIIAALTYHLFSWLGMPYGVLSIVSVFVANIFISLACSQFHQMVMQIKRIQKADLFVFFLSVILIYYNCFTMEYFGFMEAYAMGMGIYFVTLSMNFFIQGTKKTYLFSLLFAMLTALCYQSILSMYIPLLAFLVYLKDDAGKTGEGVVNYIKKGTIAFAFYGGCYILSFLIMKAYTALTGLVSGKDGAIDIMRNLADLDDLILSTTQELFRYIDPLCFYVVIVGLFAVNMVKAVYNRKYQLIVWLLIIVLLCFFVPFIPNIFLPENANYVAPRMLPSLPAVVGVLSLFYICAFEKENGYIRDCMVALTLFYSVVNAINYDWVLRNANGKYYQDRKHVEAIYDHIRQYEDESGEYVTTIYYTQDDYVSYFYSEVAVRNSYTYRMYAYDWITGAAINGFWEDRKFDFLPMEESDKDRLFKSPINFQELSDEQFVFEGSALYLLLY